MEMAGFRRGMKEYTTGVGEMEQTTDKAGGRMSKLGGALGGLAKTGLIATGAGIAAVAGGMVAYIGDATKAALETEAVRKNFDTLAESIGTTSDAMLTDLQKATRGMVKDSDLMAASNKFVSMGLADSSEEAAQLAEMATQLGMAMGVDATTSMEDFALMLANQSIPRLDTFGISSGQVRERINELMEANEDMTREQAFMIAVQEEGTKSMNRLGEQSETTAAQQAKIQATMANLKETIGQAFLPVFGELMGKFSEFVNAHAPEIKAAFQAIAKWIMEKLIPALGDIYEWLAENLPPVIEALSVYWEEVLYPALQAIWAFIEDYVIPALIDIYGWIAENLPIAIAALAKFWEETLKPALEAVWKFIKEDVVPIFETVVEWLKENIPKAIDALGKAFGWLKDNILDPVSQAFDAISNTIETVIGWIADLIDGISNLQLPDWLTPGSPTPFQLGLEGINAALADMAKVQLPALQASLGGGMGGYSMGPMLGSSSTTNNTTSVGGDTFYFQVSSPQAWGMAQKWVEGQRKGRLNRGM